MSQQTTAASGSAQPCFCRFSTTRKRMLTKAVGGAGSDTKTQGGGVRAKKVWYCCQTAIVSLSCCQHRIHDKPKLKYMSGFFSPYVETSYKFYVEMPRWNAVFRWSYIKNDASWLGKTQLYCFAIVEPCWHFWQPQHNVANANSDWDRQVTASLDPSLTFCVTTFVQSSSNIICRSDV